MEKCINFESQRASLLRQNFVKVLGSFEGDEHEPRKLFVLFTFYLLQFLTDLLKFFLELRLVISFGVTTASFAFNVFVTRVDLLEPLAQ